MNTYVLYLSAEAQTPVLIYPRTRARSVFQVSDRLENDNWIETDRGWIRCSIVMGFKLEKSNGR